MALSKLKLNEGGTGWVYNESEVERRRRLRVLTDFEGKLRTEIFRREQNPTDLEQVNTYLYYIYIYIYVFIYSMYHSGINL